MDRASLIVLQAASHVLSEKHPARDRIRTLIDYAEANLPEKADLPPDELAAIVALKLKGIDVDKAFGDRAL